MSRPGFAVVVRNELRVIFWSKRYLFVLLTYLLLYVGAYFYDLTYGPYGVNDAFGPPLITGLYTYVLYGLSFVGVIMGFDMVSGELESNRFRILLLYPIRRRTLVLARVLARFILSAFPALMATPIIALLFWQFLNPEIIYRLAVLEFLFMLGALFWLALASTFSSVARSSTASLISSVVALVLLEGQNDSGFLYNFIRSAYSLVSGHVVPLSLLYAQTSVFLLVSLVPGVSLSSLVFNLFETASLGGSRYAYPSLWDWLTGSEKVGGTVFPPDTPDYILLLSLIALTLTLMAIQVHAMRRLDV